MLASSDFLIPNATFIAELIAFVIILGILAKYVLPPINRVMSQRQEQIRSSLEEAEEGRELLTKAEGDYRLKIEEARREARTILEQATRLGEQMRTDMQANARSRYEALITRAQAEIDRSAERVANELRGQLADLVLETTRRVLERELTPEMHQAIVQEVTTSVESR